MVNASMDVIGYDLKEILVNTTRRLEDEKGFKRVSKII